MSEHDTRDLLLAWFDGDRGALDALIERDYEWIRGRVRKRLGDFLRTKGETDDFVQDAVLRVLNYGPRFVVENKAQFRALLAKLVENDLRDRLDYFKAARRDAAREQRLRTTVLELDQKPRRSEGPGEALDRQEREAFVQLGLHLLEANDRRSIVLREYDGRSFAQVGEELGISEDAARMRFNRAVTRLAKKVRELREGRLDEAAGEEAER